MKIIINVDFYYLHTSIILNMIIVPIMINIVFGLEEKRRKENEWREGWKKIVSIV